MTVSADETVCRPSMVSGGNGSMPKPTSTHVAYTSTQGRILSFDITELKAMGKGGRGLMLIDIDSKDSLAGAAAYTRRIKILGVGRGGKERDETLEIRSLNNIKSSRAKKGKVADLGFKPTDVVGLE